LPRHLEISHEKTEEQKAINVVVWRKNTHASSLASVVTTGGKFTP